MYLHTGAGRKRFSSAEMREEAEGDLTHINHASLELRRSSLVKASVSELLWPEGWARLALMAFR